MDTRSLPATSNLGPAHSSNAAGHLSMTCDSIPDIAKCTAVADPKCLAYQGFHQELGTGSQFLLGCADTLPEFTKAFRLHCVSTVCCISQHADHDGWLHNSA